MAEADPVELCPYDPAHQIRRSRLQFHLVRCAKNHTLQDKVSCPFNSTHIVDKINFQSHVAKCPDYREVQDFLCKTDPRELKGIVPFPQRTDTMNVAGLEDWDNNPVYHHTYDPMKNSEGKPLVRSLTGASKAKRRAFRMQERARMANLVTPTSASVLPTITSDSTTSIQPLRAPRVVKVEEVGEFTPLPLPRNPPLDEWEKTFPLLNKNKKIVPEDKHDVSKKLKLITTAMKKPSILKLSEKAQLSPFSKASEDELSNSHEIGMSSSSRSNSEWNSIERQLKEVDLGDKNRYAEKDRVMLCYEHSKKNERWAANFNDSDKK